MNEKRIRKIDCIREINRKSSSIENRILQNLQIAKKFAKTGICTLAMLGYLGCGGGGGGGGGGGSPPPQDPDYVKFTHPAGVQIGEYRIYDQCNDPTLSGKTRDQNNQGYFSIHLPTIKQRFSNLATGAYSIYATYKEPATGEFITEEKIAEFLNITNIGQKTCPDF